MTPEQIIGATVIHSSFRTDGDQYAVGRNPLCFRWMSPAGRSRACRRSRKVRAPEGALPGNAWAVPKGTDGQCNREQTADGSGSPEHRQGWNGGV